MDDYGFGTFQVDVDYVLEGPVAAKLLDFALGASRRDHDDALQSGKFIIIGQAEGDDGQLRSMTWDELQTNDPKKGLRPAVRFVEGDLHIESGIHRETAVDTEVAVEGGTVLKRKMALEPLVMPKGHIMDSRNFRLKITRYNGSRGRACAVYDTRGKLQHPEGHASKIEGEKHFALEFYEVNSAMVVAVGGNGDLELWYVYLQGEGKQEFVCEERLLKTSVPAFELTAASEEMRKQEGTETRDRIKTRIPKMYRGFVDQMVRVYEMVLDPSRRGVMTRDELEGKIERRKAREAEEREDARKERERKDREGRPQQLGERAMDKDGRAVSLKTGKEMVASGNGEAPVALAPESEPVPVAALAEEVSSAEPEKDKKKAPTKPRKSRKGAAATA